MQDLITKCTGLVTQFNPLTVAPGALIKADNCVIKRENIIEDRRGYLLYGALSDTPTQLLTYLSKVLAVNGTSVSYDNGSGTFTNYSGSYSAPAGEKIRSVEAANNLYFTSSTGVQVFTDVAGTAARKSGAPRCLNIELALSSAGTPSLLSNNTSAAYQVVIKRTDANANVLFGYPSERQWLSNTSGANRDVTVTVYLNPDITIADVVQVYRTPISTIISSDSAGAELYLVYQVNPVASDIVNGFITFTDVLIDALATANATIYTAPSQEGILQANDTAPLCKDIALFKSAYMMFSNTSTKQGLYFSLLAVAGLTGNTITVGGITLQFNTTEDATIPRAKVFSGGTTAQNIDNTARSIVKMLNRYTSNTTLNAFYASGYQGLPGQIFIQARNLGFSAFTITSSNATISAGFYPNPPTSGTTSASTSSNTSQKNAIYFSKSQQFDAVPTLNYLLAGAANKNILRIAPLRDSVVVIKEDGVFLLRGDSPSNFTINPLDLTTICRATDSVVILANQVIMLSNQGVVAISENGVSVISREIEPNIIPLLTYPNISTGTTGLSYESERSYYLSTLQTSADTVQQQTYVYNIFTRTWTRWTFGFNAALVEPTGDKLYFIKPTLNSVFKERKNFDDTDYADPETAIVITATTSKTVSFTIIGATPLVGWTILQGSNTINVLTVSFMAGVYTITGEELIPVAVTAGAASIFPNVGMDIEWDTWTGQGQAAMLKQVRQIVILSDNIPGNNSATNVGVTFRSNFDSDREVVNIPVVAGAWGSGSWGSMAWGGSGDSYGYRTFVTRNKQFCMYLNPGVIHRNSRQKLVIAGYGLMYESVGEKVSK